MSQASIQKKADGFSLAYSSTVKMEAKYSFEILWTSIGLHGVISQNRILFIPTTLEASNPTCVSFIWTTTLHS
jgi:hypothetical protein